MRAERGVDRCEHPHIHSPQFPVSARLAARGRPPPLLPPRDRHAALRLAVVAAPWPWPSRHPSASPSPSSDQVIGWWSSLLLCCLVVGVR